MFTPFIQVIRRQDEEQHESSPPESSASPTALPSELPGTSTSRLPHHTAASTSSSLRPEEVQLLISCTPPDVKTIEEAVDCLVRHYNKRVEESVGEEIVQTFEEKLAFRYKASLNIIPQM